MSYRKIDPRMWDDERFVALSPEAKLTWVCVLTGPHTSGLPGLSVCGVATLSETLRYGIDTVSKALHELAAAGLMRVNPAVRVMRVPNAPKYNPCANLKVLKGWLALWKAIPDCAEKFAHIESLRASLDFSQGWSEPAWAQTFGAVSVPSRYGIETVSISTATAGATAPPQAPPTPSPGVGAGEGAARAGTVERTGFTAEALAGLLRERAKGKVLAAGADGRVLVALQRAMDDASRAGATRASYETLADWYAAGSQGWRTGRPLGLVELSGAGTLAEHLERAAQWASSGRQPIVHGRGGERPARLRPAPVSDWPGYVPPKAGEVL